MYILTKRLPTMFEKEYQIEYLNAMVKNIGTYLIYFKKTIVLA